MIENYNKKFDSQSEIGILGKNCNYLQPVLIYSNTHHYNKGLLSKYLMYN